MTTDNPPKSVIFLQAGKPGLNESFDPATGNSPVFVDATGRRKRVMQCVVGVLAVGGLTYTGLVGMSVGSAQHSPLGTFDAGPIPAALTDPKPSATPGTPSDGRQGTVATNSRPVGGRPGAPPQQRQPLPRTTQAAPVPDHEPIPESTSKPRPRLKPRPRPKPVPESTTRPAPRPAPEPTETAPTTEPVPTPTTEPTATTPTTPTTPTTEPVPMPAPVPTPAPVPSPKCEPAAKTGAAHTDAGQ